MLETINDVIKESWKIFNEGEVERAFELITSLEEKENLSREEDLRCQIAKGMYNFYMGNYNETIKIGEIAYKESLKQNKPLLAIDALFVANGGYLMLNRIWEVRSYFTLCEELLKSAIHEEPSKIKQRESYIYLMKGNIKEITGELNIAIEYYKRAFKISEEYDTLYFSRPWCQFRLGNALTVKGEYELALNSFHRALTYMKGNSTLINMQKAGNFHNTVYIKLLQGDLDESKRLNEKSLETLLNFSETPI